jgi:hypothetical protein
MPTEAQPSLECERNHFFQRELDEIGFPREPRTISEGYRIDQMICNPLRPFATSCGRLL